MFCVKACADCGSLLIRKTIFCRNCQLVFQWKEIDIGFPCYYLLDWSPKVAFFIRNFKYGAFPKDLDPYEAYLQCFTYPQAIALALPNQKNLKYNKNHAWLFAKACGFANCKDSSQKQGEQKTKNKKMRKKIRIDSPNFASKNFLLFDDVITTGESMRKMAESLDAEQVTGFALSYVKASK